MFVSGALFVFLFAFYVCYQGLCFFFVFYYYNEQSLYKYLLIFRVKNISESEIVGLKNVNLSVPQPFLLY